MNDFNNIKDWLMPKIEELGLTVEEFANECGLSKASLYMYFSDQRRPSIIAMSKICRRLGVSVIEGMRQFTVSKIGRPKGSVSTLRERRPAKNLMSRAYREKLFNSLKNV